jgi:glucose/arabinose dehydrogenase
LALERVTRGLAAPVHVAVAPGEPDRLYVVEKAGRVRVVSGGKLVRRPFLDIRGRVRNGPLIGLLSIAFHPRYAENGRFYLQYAGRRGNLYVVEFHARGGIRLPRSSRVLLRVRTSASPYSHVGGQLAFGPDGRLYAGVGDGLDPDAAQDRSSPLGKILRLDVDRPGQAQLVALGVRNPWRFSFDQATGDLYIGDVGAERWEEVDVRRAGSTAVPNYGWGVYEGPERVKPSPLTRKEVSLPLVAYRHRANGCSAIVGGFVYRGSEVRGARGRYVYGDLCTGAIWSFRVGARPVRPRVEPVVVGGSLVSFGEDARGELYALSLAEGAVYRLVSAA